MLNGLHALANVLAAQAEEGHGAAGQAAEHAAGAAHVPQPPAEVIFNLFGLPITNSIFTAWCVILILVLFCFFSTRTMRLVPSGLQNFWEMVVEVWIGVIEQTMGAKGRRFVPLITTSFLFIVASNWLGILPVVGTVTVQNPQQEVVPLFRSANSDLNVTAAMAVIMILVAEFFEFRSLGPIGYIKGLVWPNFLRWLEIATRPLSLAFRLFGNIFAGEVLVATMLSIAPFAVFAFLGLEVFVGFIQAIVFAMLTMVFLTMATLHEHPRDAAHEAPRDHTPADGQTAVATRAH